MLMNTFPWRRFKRASSQSMLSPLAKVGRPTSIPLGVDPGLMAAQSRVKLGTPITQVGRRSWDKDLLGEVLGDIMGDVDTTPLPPKRVGETNIGELSLLQQAGPEVGDISTSMDRFWKKKLGYA